jgi:thiol:disulfide interchange protein/DsbC/DsbD-like thiol-disulfide interchange protein
LKTSGGDVIGAILGGLLVLATAFGVAAPARAASAPVDPVGARLVAESAAIAPGERVWLDLHLDIAPGWHTYWRNPGDSGLPTKIDWTLPAGFRAGAIRWPVPQRFVQGGIGNYGYRGTTDLLVPIAAPADLKPAGTVRLAARASWLVCSEICIPGAAQLALALPVGASPAPPDPAVAGLFAAARAQLPQPAPFAARFFVSGGDLQIAIPAAALAGLARPQAAFFPFAANAIDAASPPRQERHGDGLMLVLARNRGPTASLPATLAGVLVVNGAGGAERAYRLSAPIVAAPEAAGDGAASVWWWQALLLAFLGGLALNLMPCVFPVLSLKLLGLAASVHRAEERRHGLAYGGGVVLSFALLGGALLLLRAAGAAIGWGFQLQSPVVVGLLAYLLFAMGLSLSGVADFGLGLGGIGSRFADRAGLWGAFATGVLATVVATPCTAPFMGAALGFALFAPTALALLTFVVLGLGLAAPIVVASAVPGLARWLPPPGPWMGWFKQLLAFPLYGTVAWLLWVLIQEVGASGALFALLGLVAVGFAVWVYGRTRQVMPGGRRLGSGLAAGAAAAALVVAATLAPAGAPRAAGSGDLGYRPFSAARLARLATEHRPVFVDLTAAWCLTCLVNERTTLDSAAVRRAFAAKGIVALKGDWTRQNPDITRFLQKFGRSGVPLYLLYNRAGRPTVLPQLLSEAGLLAAVGKI